MELHEVEIETQRGRATRVIRAESYNAAVAAMIGAGVVVPAARQEPAPVEGRLYGRSAEGPRRNRDEMAEDRQIEALAEQVDYELPEFGTRAAAELLEELEGKAYGR